MLEVTFESQVEFRMFLVLRKSTICKGRLRFLFVMYLLLISKGEVL